MERRFTVEAEIEILKHEVSVLKALCADLRKTMKAQDDMKEEERAKKNELARKTKTVMQQEMECCEATDFSKKHEWVKKTRDKWTCIQRWQECEFCGEKKIGSEFVNGEPPKRLPCDGPWP